MADYVQDFQQKLIEAGLAVDCPLCDGLLHRCGTVDKPHSKNGAYIIFADPPASLWWKNWATGDEGTHCINTHTKLTPAEREAFTKRVAEAKAIAAQDKAHRHVAASQKAKTLWGRATVASNEHPYLVRKGVPAIALRTMGKGNILIVPFLNTTGHMQSLQFIQPDGTKRFLTGGKIQGGFCPIPAKDGAKDGPLCICEGYATAASIHLATGHAVLCAFNAGNLLAVAEAARALYPQRQLILCADNDIKADAPNVGLDAATTAAQAVKGLVAVPPAHEGKPTDFNDLHLWRGLDAVRACVEGAKEPHIDAKTALRVLDLQEMLTIEMPPREYVVHPVIPEQGLCLLYAARGVGKTHTALSIAYAVASGSNVLKWTCPKPRQVLYIDGEMPFSAMQERLAALVQAHDTEPDPRFLRILTPDMQGKNPMPNLATSEGQDAVAPYLDGVALVVIDNLATLCRSGRANDEESWLPVQAWILELRRRGISVLIVHHASKNGGQRGTSAKEDVLDTVISLSRPKDYNPEEGARFEVHLTKARGIFGPDAEPFEARLESAGTRSYWTVRSLEDALQSQVRTLANDGMTQREIAAELEVSKSAVNRLCKKFCIDTRGGK